MHRCADGMGRDHRLGDQAFDGAEDERVADGRVGDDGKGRINGKISDEHAEPAKYHAF